MVLILDRGHVPELRQESVCVVPGHPVERGKLDVLEAPQARQYAILEGDRTPDQGVLVNNTLAVGGYLDPYRLSKTT